MKTRAAFAWGSNQPLAIKEVDLDGPKDSEVLVRIVITSLCHTDTFTLSGCDSERKSSCNFGREDQPLPFRLPRSASWVAPSRTVSAPFATPPRSNLEPRSPSSVLHRGAAIRSVIHCRAQETMTQDLPGRIIGIAHT